MKKKILLFEPNELIRRTLIEQISLRGDLEVIAIGRFENVAFQLKQSSFDLIIMGTDRGIYTVEALRKLIKDARIKNIILFLVQAEFMDAASPQNKEVKHNFIGKPFRLEYFFKAIFTILAKISNSKDITHKIGPFTFFPLKKFIILGDDKKVELTEKEVDILKCLISSGEEVVDRDKLLKQVWNYSSDVTTHTLETHIYRLRQKLEIYPSIPRLIISQGGGFRILQF